MSLNMCVHMCVHSDLLRNQTSSYNKKANMYPQ